MDQEVFGLEFGDPGPGWKVGQAKVCVKAGLRGHERRILKMKKWGIGSMGLCLMHIDLIKGFWELHLPGLQDFH